MPPHSSVQPDSTLFIDSTLLGGDVTLCVSPAGQTFRSLDAFLYVDSEIKTMEAHSRVDFTNPISSGAPSISIDSDISGGAISFCCTAGDKILVLVANSPPLQAESLHNYETLEQLSYEYLSEDPLFPLAVGAVQLSLEDGCTAHVELPMFELLCPVVVEEITRDMEGYSCLESPRVFLKDVNASAQLLRFTGFRPTETVSYPGSASSPDAVYSSGSVSDPRFVCSSGSGLGASDSSTFDYDRTCGLIWSPLPCDVGIFPQHPGTKLYCYPNDSEKSTMGMPCTTLVLECELDGSTCRFPAPLGAIHRGESVYVSFTVRSPESYSFTLRRGFI